jgi:hypothetical protein
VLAGVLLLLVAAAPLAAAGPPSTGAAARAPSTPADSRRAWLFNQGAFRSAGSGRWVQRGPSGTFRYREHQRTAEYVELFDASRKRFVRLYQRGWYVFVPKKKHYALVGLGRWALYPRQRPLDQERNTPERPKLSTAEHRAGFPRLGDEYEVMGEGSVAYNCIGWSVGNTTAWVWPGQAGQDIQLADFDSLYSYYGFRRVAGLDYKPVPGSDKVVLYALRRADGSISLTHAALQLRDGSWSSKLGSLPLIRHLHPDDVAGPSYGVPYVLYVRPRNREDKVSR